MDETLVQHAEHDVHRDNRRNDEYGLAFERRGKFRGAADQACLNSAGQADISLRAIERLYFLSERNASRQVERERYRRELALVRDGERSHALVHLRKSSERNLLGWIAEIAADSARILLGIWL